MFEGGGGDGVEFFAAPGNLTSFDAAVFRLVGDVAEGGLAATTALNAQVFEQLGITTNQTDSLRTVLRALRANAGDF
jgi:predicted NAD/FAD-binding protein